MRTSIAPIGTGLPGATALAAFRIAQEALRNVEKHARATSVRVGLARTAHELRLTVSDTGIGFSPAAVARGIGLASMRERAAAMGASIVIKSSPGRGAEVRLLVPLTPPARLPALAPNPSALPGTRP
jgi:signal transduction histidine kinase